MPIKMIVNPLNSNTIHIYVEGSEPQDVLQCVNWLIINNYINPAEFLEGLIQFNRDKGIPSSEKDPMHYPLVVYSKNKILSVSGIEAARQDSPKFAFLSSESMTRTDALICIVALMGFKVDEELRGKITGPSYKFDKLNPEIIIPLKKDVSNEMENE